jgi:hypothetical protein
MTECDAMTATLSVRVDSRRRVIISKYEGKLTYEDVKKQWSEIRKHPEFNPGFASLVDFSLVTSFDVSYGEQEILAAERDPFSPESRRVYVAPQDLIYGLLRVYQAHSGDRLHLNLHVVRSLSEAWVILDGTRGN